MQNVAHLPAQQYNAHAQFNAYGIVNQDPVAAAAAAAAASTQQHHVAAGVPTMQQPSHLQQQQPLDPNNPHHLGMAKLNELRECVDDISKDAGKFFEKGNKAAGVRARKKLQLLKTLSQELRVNIQKCKADLAAANAMNAQQTTDEPTDQHHVDDGQPLAE